MNERLGTELSAAARQVIADSRAGDEPSAEDEARVKARWLAGIAAGAGVSSLSEAVRAAASTGWGLKAGALIAALVATSAGVYLGWPQLSESRRAPAASSTNQAAPRSAPTEPVAVTPAPVAAAGEAAHRSDVNPASLERVELETGGTEPVVLAAPSAAEPQLAPQAAPSAAAPAVSAKASARKTAPTPARSVPARRAVPAPAQPAEQSAPAPELSGQLGEEIALLSDIRSDLQSGAATRALERLATYRQRFGQPNLAMEADALRVDALCRAGQREAARAEAGAFSSRWPGSPLQQRVSAACP